jgi:hypothetical protein
MRGKAKASLILAVDDIRRRGCAAAGVRLAGEELSAVCRMDLYGAWRLLTIFETPDRCVLLVVAEHTRSANPYQLLYEVLGIGEPESLAPSRRAVTPTGSHLSARTLWCVSSAACGISPAGSPPLARPAASVAAKTRSIAAPFA